MDNTGVSEPESEAEFERALSALVRAAEDDLEIEGAYDVSTDAGREWTVEIYRVGTDRDPK